MNRYLLLLYKIVINVVIVIIIIAITGHFSIVNH